MIIYLLRNTVNGKVYIGKTKGTASARWKAHIKSAQKGSNLLLHNAIRKYGREAFTVETLCSAIIPEALNELERFFIAQYRAYPPKLGFGYNMSPGGDGGAEIRLGKTQSVQARRKLSAYRKAHPVIKGSLTAQRISQALQGRKFTKEWSARKSEAQRGRKNPRFLDKAGQTFGHLLVLYPSQNQHGRGVIWTCRCVCGALHDVRSPNLRESGGTRSCGCRRERKS